MDAPQTWFRWNDSDENVAKASPEVFDAWISQYVEEITDVDRSAWEIFQRWEIVNECIKAGVLKLQQSEEKASIAEVEVEAKASDEDSDKPSSQAG